MVIKGGHLKGGAKDFLFTKNEQFVWESPRIQTCHTHGTGCTFAAVITAELAKGKSLYQAVDKAKAFITKLFKMPLNSVMVLVQSTIQLLKIKKKTL